MHLTGTPQHPVNFPGSSVERVESSVQVGASMLRVVDLPGIGSLSALSRDEQLAIDFLKGPSGADHPDVLCAVLDASKLSVELRLLGQLSGLGLPVVVALNKNDVARGAGRPVDAEALSAQLGMVVVETNAMTGGGVAALKEALLRGAGGAPAAPLEADPDALVKKVQGRAIAPSRTLTDRIDAV